MEKYAIVRDDDPNFFTSTKTIEVVYNELFSMKVPISSSVIPCVETGLKLKNAMFHGNHIEYEAFVPEKYRSVNQQFPVYENRELIEFLTNSKDQLNIVQHGFNHSPHEFSSINLGRLNKKVLLGKKILQKAFGESPQFFCAPYDIYSPVSFLLLQKYFRGATFGEIKIRTMISPKFGLRLPPYMIPSYLRASDLGRVFCFSGGFLLLGYDNVTCINPFENSDASDYEFKEYVKAHQVVVIGLHHWEFFYDKGKRIVGERVDKTALEFFVEKIRLLKDLGFRFLTISQFYDKMS
jgi:hypothetical protein